MIDIGVPPSVERLRWQCRRGMLELDVVLSAFLERRYPNLDPIDQHRFVALLRVDDPTLNAWLFGTEHPGDAATRALLDAVKQAAMPGD